MYISYNMHIFTHKLTPSIIHTHIYTLSYTNTYTQVPTYTSKGKGTFLPSTPKQRNQDKCQTLLTSHTTNRILPKIVPLFQFTERYYSKGLSTTLMSNSQCSDGDICLSPMRLTTLHFILAPQVLMLGVVTLYELSQFLIYH